MRKCFLIIAALLGMAQYCEGRDVLVAGGGGFALTPDDLWLEVSNLGPSYAYGNTYQDRSKLVDVIATRFFLSEEADRRGLGEDGLAETVSSAERDALTDAYHEWKVSKAVRVPRVESKTTLEDLDRRLHFKEAVFAVHAVAAEALKDLKSGTSFDKLVASVAGREDVTVSDLGWKVWDDFDRDVACRLYQLRVGEFTDVLQSKAGYCIFYLVEDRPWGARPELIRLRSKRFVRTIKEAERAEQERAELSRFCKVAYSERGVAAAMRAFAISFGGGRPPDSLLACDLLSYAGGSLNVANLFTYYYSLPAASQPYVGDAYAIKESALDDILPDLEAAGARAMGLDRLPEVLWKVKKAREEYLIPKMEEWFMGRITLAPDDPIKYFNEHRSQLATPKTYRVRRILLDSPESAKVALKEVRSGLDFGEVAREKSLDQYSSSKGGDLGYIQAGMVQAYDSVLVNLKPGDVTRPFPTTSGVEILKLEELVESRPLSFEEANTMIENTILSERANDSLAVWADARKKEVGYRVNESLLKRIDLPEPAWKKTVAKQSPSEAARAGKEGVR